MLFDCKGFQLVELYFKDGWVAESTSGMKYKDINFYMATLLNMMKKVNDGL